MVRIFLRVSALLLVIGVVLAAMQTSPVLAQGIGSIAQQASSMLTSQQQASANSALCSALGSQVSNPSAASPSLLSSPKVISAAAPLFASRVHLPLPGATTLLEKYVSQHATDILTSCAVSNATGGMTSKIPGGSSIPSVPNMP
jgi:hypothetical protein